MLNPPEHQVAGHDARLGGLGPLADGSGRFFKPLQSCSRGDNELSFYTSFSSDPRVPPSVRRRFFPSFHGTQLLPASDSSGPKPHLVLQDLTSQFTRPSIIDFKIGSRTWPPSSPSDYIDKCFKKDRETTSLTLGFRVSGLQIHESGDAYYKPSRDEIRSYGHDDVRRIVRRFVSDSGLASAVYGGSDGILAQLLELKSWFEDQTIYHFYSASVMVMYDKEGVENGRSGPAVKLVDFAHVVEGDGVIDHNFLGGLCSLIKFVSEVLTDPDGEGEGRRMKAKKGGTENGK
ncbi:inositol hexaphosphate kinase [Iris pallida]|uniref:Inositol polyphosphate multikinase n=1 Tax=Iris pallida TaxID=29817 RepID=A0AAX6HX60_IRIPA|nr:inositol hexaphosphate kinase [Iris pallida]